MALSVARQALAAGLDVVLDCAFLERAHRDEARRFAESAGVPSKLHWVRADTEIRRRRVEERNRQRGDTFAVHVAEGMFDSLAWEPPSADELDGAIIVDT